MIRGSSLRGIFESNGHAEGTRRILHALGYCDQRGQRYRAPSNATSILEVRNPREGTREVTRLRPNEFSFQELAFATMGWDYQSRLTPQNVNAAIIAEAMACGGAGSALTEDVGSMAGAINATAFGDINAFTAITAGLLEISMMDGWQNPDFIMDSVMTTESTKMFEGKKSIGTSRLGDVGEERQPGEPTKRAQIGERWVTMPRTVENSLACLVTEEAVFLDLTGEVLQHANDVGEWIRWRKEIRQIDAWLGLSVQYNYKGTTYAPWQSLGYFNNSLSNELFHWQQVQNCRILFRDMLDVETGLRVQIRPNTVIVNEEKYVVAQSIFGELAESTEQRDAPGSTTQPQTIDKFRQPFKGQYKILTSPLIFQRMTDPTTLFPNPGMGLSANQASKYWWLFESGKVMRYMQNRPFRTQTAAPNQVDMLDRGIILYTRADERGTPMWWEPRRAVQNTN